MSIGVYAPKFLSYSKASGLMKELIVNGSRDPKVRDFALRLIAQVPEMFSLAEAEILHCFVRNSIRYTDDTYSEDVYQLASLTLENGCGDCDDKVILLGSLARSVGFPVRICFVFMAPPGSAKGFNQESEFPTHVYLEMDMNKGQGAPRWVPAETVPAPKPDGGFGYLELGEAYPWGYVDKVQVDD